MLSPSWVEDTTDTISPRLGPLLAEYRSSCSATAFADKGQPRVAPKESGLVPGLERGLRAAAAAYHQQDTADAYTEALEEFRKQIGSHAQFLSESTPGHPEAVRAASASTGKGHLVVCVHGMSGNQ